MMDTPLDVEMLTSRMLMTRSPEERLRMVGSMFEAGKELIKAGLLMRHGALTRAQLRGLTFQRLYSADFTSAEITQIAASIPDMDLVISGSGTDS